MKTSIFLSYDKQSAAVALAVQNNLARRGHQVVDAGRQIFDKSRWPIELRWMLSDCDRCLIVAGANALLSHGMLRRQIGVAIGLGISVTWLLPSADADIAKNVAPGTINRAYFDDRSFQTDGNIYIDYDDLDPVFGDSFLTGPLRPIAMSQYERRPA